ncbi:MAG: ParB/RepB/Spo0J family partition protein [Solirubrobacteraceae bacterium]
MTPPRRGMGRGLDAILSVTREQEADQELRNVPVDLVAPSASQPRRRFDEEPLNALAASLGERGVLQPVLLRPLADGRYEMIAGERRWRAAKIAGLAEIPAIVRSHGDAEAMEIALIENMAREDLNPVEEARACAALVEELGLTREQVGTRVGRSRVAVSNLMRLLDLPDEALALIEKGVLSEGHGRALLLAEDHAARRRLARECAGREWSVRTLEAQARNANGVQATARKTLRRRKPTPDADQLAASSEIAELLEQAMGAEVKVSSEAQGRYRAELVFESVQEAQELARRLGGAVADGQAGR